MNISVLAPASLKAFAESYSQFVPGNTGISTDGPFPVLTLNDRLLSFDKNATKKGYQGNSYSDSKQSATHNKCFM